MRGYFRHVFSRGLQRRIPQPKCGTVIGYSCGRNPKRPERSRIFGGKQGEELTSEEMKRIPVGGSLRCERERIHQKTGQRQWYQETLYHMDIEGREKFILIMADRTKERQDRERLDMALDIARSANEAKSSFLSNMSHDIRTPMNAIVGFAMLLERDMNQPGKVQEYARKITISSQHLLNLINDVLDMSKIESGKTTRIWRNSVSAGS